jgi:hypothetical protein
VKVVYEITGVVAVTLKCVAGPNTVRVAEAVLLVPEGLEVTGPLVLLYEPTALAVTFTDAVQTFEGFTRPSATTVIVPDPGTAVTLKLQEPVWLALFGVATVMPAGRVSVNPTELAGPKLLSVTVKVRVETPPGAIAVGLNALLIVKLVAPWSAGAKQARKMMSRDSRRE